MAIKAPPGKKRGEDVAARPGSTGSVTICRYRVAYRAAGQVSPELTTRFSPAVYRSVMTVGEGSLSDAINSIQTPQLLEDRGRTVNVLKIIASTVASLLSPLRLLEIPDSHYG